MLCDEAFNKLPWQAMLRGRLRARWRARMILLTHDGRAELAGDLVRAGGFDFLTHPFDKDQVFATLISAYAQWRGNEYPSVSPPSLTHDRSKMYFPHARKHHRHKQFTASRLRMLRQPPSAAEAR